MELLIIGDLNGQVGAASTIAKDRGARVMQVGDIPAALEHLREGRGGELIMIDVKQDIKTLVESLKTERIHLPVIACGFDASSDEAVRAIKAGAKEYLPLPPDTELIAAVLEAVTKEEHQLIFAAERMQQVVQLADQIAPSDASVLITGESGTGKEVIARYLHSKSKRAKAKLVCVNCAAIPDNLLESELFGHEKGAFTGAVSRRVGKFEEANGGTLFLDEISEMDLRLQAKLLRAIQEKEIDRVGGTAPVKVDIRIFASSNRNLQEAVANGEFREDLYFRLNVINLQLPPLRERKADIEKLAEHFIAKYAKANGVPLRPLSDEALTNMMNYHWPGNVRELENTMHRAVLLAQGNEITPSAIMLNGMPGTAANEGEATTSNEATSNSNPEQMGGLVGRTVESVERDLILSTLDHCLGNRTHAANILGISIRTMRNKLKQYADEGVEIPAAKEAK